MTLYTRPQEGFLRPGLTVRDEDGELVEKPTFFNVALLSGFAVVSLAFLVVAALFIATDFIPLDSLFKVLTMYGGSVVVYGFFYWLNRQGHYNLASHTYLGLMYLALVITTLLYDGPFSAVWAFFLWPILLAAVFISPRVSFFFFLSVIGVWMVEFGLVQADFWQPTATVLSRRAHLYAPLFFFGAALVSLPVLLAALYYSQHTRALLTETTRSLETSRIAIEEQVRAQQEEARHREEIFEFLADLHALSVVSGNLDSLLRSAVELMDERFPFYYVAIYLIDERGRRAVREIFTTREDGKEWDELVHYSVSRGEGLVGHVARTGESYFTPEVVYDERFIPHERLPLTQSAAAVPIEMLGRILGVLEVHGAADHPLREADVQLLVLIANSLAVAITNLRQGEEALQTLERLSRYEQQDFLRQWRQSLQRRGGTLRYLYDRVRVRSLPPDTPLPLKGVDGGEEAELTTLEQGDGSHLLVVPVRVRGEVLGRFAFESDEPWEPEEMDVVRTVVGQLALALENARLLETTRRNALLEQTAGELTSRIRAQVEIEAALEQALTDLGRALGAERATARISVTARGKE